jgi:hypothetical protein
VSLKVCHPECLPNLHLAWDHYVHVCFPGKLLFSPKLGTRIRIPDLILTEVLERTVIYEKGTLIFTLGAHPFEPPALVSVTHPISLSHFIAHPNATTQSWSLNPGQWQVLTGLS